MQHSAPDTGTGEFLFASFAPEDSGIVLPVLTRMQQDGFPVWFRTEQTDSDAYSAQQKQCGTFIVFLSKRYLANSNRRQELISAWEQDKQLLPVYLEDLELPDSLAMRIGRNQALFYHRYRQPDAFYEKLYSAPALSGFQEKEKDAETFSPKPRSKKPIRIWLLVCVVAVVAAMLLFVMGGSLPWLGNADPVDKQIAVGDILAETDQLKVAFHSYKESGDAVLLTLSVSNKTEDDIFLSSEDCLVNGTECDPKWNNFIKAGYTAEVQLRWEKAALEAAGIDSAAISTLDCGFSGKFRTESEPVQPIRFTCDPKHMNG